VVKVFGLTANTQHWTKVIPPKQHKACAPRPSSILGLTADRVENAARLNRDVPKPSSSRTTTSMQTVEKLPHYDTDLEAAFFMFEQIGGSRIRTGL